MKITDLEAEYVTDLEKRVGELTAMLTICKGTLNALLATPDTAVMKHLRPFIEPLHNDIEAQLNKD